MLGSTLLSVAGLLAVARWVPEELRASDHDAKAAFLSMAGVAYTILLAFVVVAVWSDFTEAGQTSQQEVTRLSNLMRDVGTFPAAARIPMRRGVLGYANAVVRHEWPTMADGKAAPAAAQRYEAMWSRWYRYSPRGAGATAFYEESVSRLNEVAASRRARLIESRANLPTAMVLLLLLGFAVSMGFTYQFKMARLTMHVLSVAAIAALMGFVLFLIFSLEHPFAGKVAISPAPWREFIDTWAGRPL